MHEIVLRIAASEAAKDRDRLKQLRQALTDLRPVSHYASLPDAEAARIVELVDAALARLGKPSPKPRQTQPRRKLVPLDISSIEQGDLFADPERWPRRPWCTDDLAAGLRIRALRQAVLHPYISANPPHLRVWSLHDIDRSDAAIAWEQAGLPPPAWTAVNRANGHAHSAWGLSAPVLVDGLGARDAPMRYLCAIESLMRERMQADRGFVGLITKNPAWPGWHVLRGPRLTYDLAELAAALPGIEKHRPHRRPELVGLGRNVALFDALRKWAYKGVRAYWGGGLSGWNAWLLAANSQALEMNADLFGGRMLDGREVWHLARSVAKWTWRHFSQANFSAWQAARGAKGGRPATTTANGAPWEAEGVSRATWYRRRGK
jgi:hypothetical protein